MAERFDDVALGFDPKTNSTSGALASVQDNKVMICQSVVTHLIPSTLIKYVY